MSASSVYGDPHARRALGATGLLVTPLCVGGAEFGSVAVLGYEVPEDRAGDTADSLRRPDQFPGHGCFLGQR
jgi:hypothetical protein